MLMPRRMSSVRAAARLAVKPMRRHSGSYTTSTGVGSRASDSYASLTNGVRRATSFARASPSCVPFSANCASHTSRVISMSSVMRPFDCFNNTLRCRMIRSTSNRSASLRVANATRASSNMSRRTDGPSYTNCKSVGANTVHRTTPNKSRTRASLCLLTNTLLRPARFISVSTKISRPSSCTTNARTYAVSAPSRTNASFATPRKLCSVDK